MNATSASLVWTITAIGVCIAIGWTWIAGATEGATFVASLVFAAAMGLGARSYKTSTLRWLALRSLESLTALFVFATAGGVFIGFWLPAGLAFGHIVEIPLKRQALAEESLDLRRLSGALLLAGAAAITLAAGPDFASDARVSAVSGGLLILLFGRALALAGDEGRKANEQSTKFQKLLGDSDEKLRTTRVELVQANRLVGANELANDLLHDIANAANSSRVALELERDRHDEDEVLQGLERIERSVEDKGLEGLISQIEDHPRGPQLLEYLSGLAGKSREINRAQSQRLESALLGIQHITSMIESQQQRAKSQHGEGPREIVELADVIEGALNMIRARVEGQGTTLEATYDFVPAIHSDPNAIVQIVTNLVLNANQSIERRGLGRGRIELRLVAQLERDRACLEVKDDGAGIRPEDLEHIFSYGFTTRAEGSGFGLHSASIAARCLGGRLRAFSDGPGLGARFLLELPIEAARLEPTG